MFTVAIWAGVWTPPGLHALTCPAVPDPVGGVLERTCALALGQARTVALVCDPDRREYNRNPSDHLSFRGRQTEGQRAFQQEDVALRAHRVK